MSRGYITHAVNNGSADYVRMAYALALSIRRTQSRVDRLTVVIADDQPMPERYRHAFDHVVTVPNVRPSAVSPAWRVDNFVRLRELTPYDETVTLDADMLFFDDVSDWWDRLAEQDVVGGTAYTCTGELIVGNPLRTDLYEVGLPDLHNGFLYFKSNDATAALFATMNDNLADWPATSTRHFGRPDVPFSSDCAFLTALRDHGMEQDAVSRVPGIPRFVHMKACLQGWPGVGPQEREWRQHADHYFDDDLSLHINGQRIGDPFHYHVRDFVTDDLLKRYEEDV